MFPVVDLLMMGVCVVGVVSYLIMLILSVGPFASTFDADDIRRAVMLKLRERMASALAARQAHQQALPQQAQAGQDGESTF